MKKSVLHRITELLAVILLVVLSLCLAESFCESNFQGNVSTLGNGWYQIHNGEREEITLPFTANCVNGEKITLYNDTLTSADAGLILSADGVQYGLEIWVGNQLLYHYQDSAFPKNEQMKGKLRADVQLPDIVGQEPLRVEFTGVTGKIRFLAPLIGSNQGIVRQHLADSAFSLVIILLMMALGMMALVIFFYMHHHKILEWRFLDTAAFLLLCGFWCLTDSGIFQMYAQYTALWCLLSFYAFMLLAIPMLQFVKNTVREGARWLPDLFCILFYVNAGLQGMIHLLWGVPFVWMLEVTHVLLAAGVVAMTILLYHEYVRKSVDKASLYLTAFSILGFSGVLALLFYWLFEIHWYDAIFQFGILLFIGLLFWNLIRQVSDDIRFRTEQKISEQIAREDRMTGFKNRLAFQEYLERIQNQAESYQNVVLTYILLENLNDLNNVYGTHTGDEAVIGAARCIERVCTATAGDCMELFRISGNEYAILYPNPAVEYIELDPYIQAEVERYNRICTSQRRIRLVCGYDCLRRKDGTIQNISGWKAGADAKLQENRKRAGGEMKW